MNRGFDRPNIIWANPGFSLLGQACGVGKCIQCWAGIGPDHETIEARASLEVYMGRTGKYFILIHLAQI
jgi:hypothetical protein